VAAQTHLAAWVQQSVALGTRRVKPRAKRTPSCCSSSSGS